jgi:hypothetical protein
MIAEFAASAMLAEVLPHFVSPPPGRWREEALFDGE